MDSFELNKILGALLFTCLLTLTLNITAGAVFAPEKLAKPGFEIAVPEGDAAAAGGAAAPAEETKSIAELLASADPKKGEAAVKKCASCHNFTKGGPNGIGPNLYGVVGRAKGSHAGFNYSDAVKAKGGDWTFEDIDHFITNPKKFIPGTKMTYAGDAKGTDRANILAYLNQNSDNPQPLPKVAEAKPAEGAGGDKPAAAPGGDKPAAAPGGEKAAEPEKKQ
jgi:cytochrome c